MKILILFAAVLIILSACRRTGSDATLTGQSNPEWPAMKKMVREKFPDVDQVSTAELAGLLSKPEAAKPLLLDARSSKEYAVSHLQNALLAENESQALEALKGHSMDHPIVIYCSIGYRSSQLAQKLKKSGYSNVKNLEGSIFEWANDGRDLYRDQVKSTYVHPFDEKWGRLLERKYWSFDPR